MAKAPTFEQAGRDWQGTLTTMIQRNGRPLSGNTQRIYAGTLARLVNHIGAERLPISNLVIKKYVAKMRQKYSASVIVADINVIKLVCESIANENGDFVYPLKINHKFCATPVVNAEDQKTPCATAEDVERGLAGQGIVPGFVAILSQGLRISEALALYVGDTRGTEDSWDGDDAVIHIRRTLKTPSAARTVYLPLDLNMFLLQWCHRLANSPRLGTRLFQVSRSEVYNQMKVAKLPAPHSFRRLRVTVCRKAGMNEEVLKRLIGHSRGASVTTRYDRTRDDVDFIRAEVERVGLGFTLPAAALTAERVPVAEVAVSA